MYICPGSHLSFRITFKLIFFLASLSIKLFHALKFLSWYYRNSLSSHFYMCTYVCMYYGLVQDTYWFQILEQCCVVPCPLTIGLKHCHYPMLSNWNWWTFSLGCIFTFFYSMLLVISFPLLDRLSFLSLLAHISFLQGST